MSINYLNESVFAFDGKRHSTSLKYIIRSHWSVILFILLTVISPQQALFRLYPSGIIEDFVEDYDCLHYYSLNNLVEEEFYDHGPVYQLIPFCQRSTQYQSHLDYLRERTTMHKFASLRQQGVTSEDLYASSSVLIEIIEEYQAYLQNESTFSWSNIFYNCSSLRFGPFCQYEFHLEDEEFNNIVYYFYNEKDQKNDVMMQVPCYLHLQCNFNTTMCLDWREICDGKVDCLVGNSDEEFCHELEMNECADNEYRCHNGMCVPSHFYNDNELNPDCLDGSDEHYLGRYGEVHDYYTCYRDPTFRCEERTCRALLQFPCGDGRCFDITVPISFEDSVSCHNYRDLNRTKDILVAAINEDSLNVLCMHAIACLSHWDDELDILCDESTRQLLKILKRECPSYFPFPTLPVMLGHVYFLYAANKTKFGRVTIPDMVCYNQTLCPFLSATVPPLNRSLKYSACRYFFDLPLLTDTFQSWLDLTQAVHGIFRACSSVPDITRICPPSMFRCDSNNTSKCISQYRLGDGIKDCFENKDEPYSDTCELHHRQRHFLECYSIRDPQKRICLSPMRVRDHIKDCADFRDEEENDDRNQAIHPPFPRICDLIPDMFPVQELLNIGQNETDETNCPLSWPCNNVYTQCDGLWNCLDGADEANCNDKSWPCPANYHPCVRWYTNELDCLPLSRAGNNIVDCRGATDEQQLCRASYPGHTRRYRCSKDINDTTCINVEDMCDSKGCSLVDQQPYCQNRSNWVSDDYCLSSENKTMAEKYLCNELFGDAIFNSPNARPIMHLRLSNSFASSKPTYIQRQHLQRSWRFIDDDDDIDIIWHCHRGIPVKMIGRDRNETNCFCPPAYYGPRCQYQNQRVSLTLQFRRQSGPADRFSIFYVVIMLVDDQQIVQSHEHIIYLPARDCNTKFNIYLLYTARPKSNYRNYSVRIDAFEQDDVPKYYVSWLVGIPFQFLPVNRLALQLVMPSVSQQPVACSLPCGEHGQCMRYYNTPNALFCQCSTGWSGSHCNMSRPCNCSPDSICTGHYSICVCPVGKFGPRCYLTQSTACRTKPCLNVGFCATMDERISENASKFTCLCTEEFSGTLCELNQARIDMTFSRELTIPPSILVHFINVRQVAVHVRTTTFRKIGLEYDSVTIFLSNPFHIVFVEFSYSYYLLVLQEDYNASATLSVHLQLIKRCPPIAELFDSHIHQDYIIRRIKHYYELCQQRTSLPCFHDETYMCLCTENRHANCFLFDFNMTYDCQGLNYCENGGQCFQDDPSCPKTSLCMCAECFFGSKCQFSTQGFALSLDAILAYQIRPHVLFVEQFLTVKVSICITILMFTLGFVNSCLSILTFQRKESRELGCGIYLFASSIMSLFIICLLNLKCWLLIASQMALVTNRLLLYIQCVSIDGLLKVSLNSSEFLSACVAIERSFIVTRGIKFDKKKSKQVAKWAILAVFVVVVSTNIHDPIHRTLMDDDDEQRTWCIVKYSRSLQSYDTVINIIHFLTPFVIHFISANIIIIAGARQQSTAHRNLTYSQTIRRHFKQHKHLLISPCILILLSLPRLIISVLTGCMKSIRDPWLFLIGYFLSYVPHMLTFAVYILPSDIYMKEFKAAIKHLYTIFHN